MQRKFILIFVIFMLALSLPDSFSRAQVAEAPSAWPGSWQLGPSFDTTLLGCSEGDGLARFTGIYYPELDRVYFLGGRCEDNTTTGRVFYFDPTSRSFVITSADMIIPVSNYQVVRLDDDGNGYGPGLYIIGGREGDGNITTAIQAYYPESSILMRTFLDPFAPASPNTPGGVVEVSNKIYAFGGFDGASMYATTWVYDPSEPEGSRWADTMCDLPTGRSYIATVAVGNLIYAIGGDHWDGGSLLPIADTLVLDTSNVAACWQDGLMADLPAPVGDAPAVYVGENFLGGGIFVMGGHWPDPYNWVYRYDMADNIWEAFPSLLLPEEGTGLRNEAAVYIPSTSGGTGQGIPGLWTFGGYSGGSTMTPSSEFFANPAVYIMRFFLPSVRK